MTNSMPSDRQPLNTRLFRHAFILFGLVLITFVVYRTALQIGFIADDFRFLTLDIPRILSMSDGIYRPFGLILFSLTSQWLGDNAPIGLHILGIALHAFNSYLLFRFAWALTGNPLASMFAAVVWLFSPTAVEPIYWLSALVFYIPMTSLILLALLLGYHRFKLMSADKPTMQANDYLRLGIFLAIFWACSMMFHEIALVTPLILFIMFYGGVFFPRPKINFAMQFLLWLPMIFIAVAYGIIRVALSAPSQLMSFGISQRASWVIYAIWRSFLPTESIIWHVIHFIENLHPVAALTLVILFLGTTVAILWRSAIYRPIGWGLLITIIAALPPIVFSSTGGRYLYLSTAMAALSLGIVGTIVIQKIAKVKLLIFKGGHIQNFARILLLVTFLVLLGMNFWRANDEIQHELATSQLVRNLESQVAELVSRPLLARYSDRQPIPIFLLDFPIGTLTSAGVSRTIHQAIPELANPLQVSQVYFNDRNPYITNGRFGRYVEEREIIDMQKSAIVLVYCEQEQAVFLLGPAPVPCLKLGIN